MNGFILLFRIHERAEAKREVKSGLRRRRSKRGKRTELRVEKNQNLGFFLLGKPGNTPKNIPPTLKVGWHYWKGRDPSRNGELGRGLHPSTWPGWDGKLESRGILPGFTTYI